MPQSQPQYDKLREYAKAGNEIAGELGEDYISSMSGKEYRAFGRHQDVVMGLNISQLASIIVAYEDADEQERAVMEKAAPDFVKGVDEYKKELLDIIDICETGGLKYMFVSRRLTKLLKQVNACFGALPD